MIYLLLAYGTLPFWIAAGVVAAIVFVFALSESGLKTSAALLVTLGLLVAFSDVPVVAWFTTVKLWTLAQYVGEYIGVGILYTYARWIWHNLLVKWKYSDFKAAFLEGKGIKALNDDVMVEFWRALESKTGLKKATVVPSFLKHKADATYWLVYWPLSFLVTILDKPLHHLVTWLLRTMSGSMNAISRKMFGGFAELN